MTRTPWWRLAVVAPCALAVSCTSDAGTGSPAYPQQDYALGRAATPAEVVAFDINVGPDGAGLPPGRGSVSQGAVVYNAKCAVCHGAGGAGVYPLYPALVGRDPKAADFMFAIEPNMKRTIGDYWPYATTLFDYTRRAMPFPYPGSLTNDETYAVTAYLLSANQIIPADMVLDSASLTAVRMPSRDRFVRDNRHGGAEVR